MSSPSGNWLTKEEKQKLYCHFDCKSNQTRACMLSSILCKTLIKLTVHIISLCEYIVHIIICFGEIVHCESTKTLMNTLFKTEAQLAAVLLVILKLFS